ncbi:sugar ABC transporter substrate-binding protein [Extibacter sp. GGCC_0201]|uniref:sugar ABC transporter substrate-binding protein n=1 Tax=Extibacter sp. GGCC_0201 TaxID=2731209 RepID=UPI001AA14065|nr:sugar ABC transporter substrate-binding protein [Extibacter sp. GGCC_0201]MBO1720443.1 sugar ABC transporter substrate-binding protein [Extibacter sp. GGCC_0201]
MKKKLMAILVIGAMMLSLVACGGSDGEKTDGGDGGDTQASDSGGGDGKYNISVILKTTSSEYWGYVVAGAEAYMAENPDVTVEVKGATSETAYDEQLNMIETDLSLDTIDGYVIAPLQADTVTTLIAGCEKPIVAVDTDIDAPEVLSFVGTGNENAGALGGKAAVEAAKAAGWNEIKAIEIAGVQGDSTNESRMSGYKKGIEEAGGEFLADEIQYANAVADQAVNCMEAIMQSHPEGIAIICANNDDMAMAAARTAAGNEAYKDTIFLGFDGIQSACNSILEGELTMSVCQQGYNMGYEAVDAVVRALNGETLDEFIDAGATVVDESSAQERLDELKGYLE